VLRVLSLVNRGLIPVQRGIQLATASHRGMRQPRGWRQQLCHQAQVDPALQLPGSGRLIHVDLAAGGARRLGGSCLAQAFQQVRSSLYSELGGTQQLSERIAA
jgi:hypothetical protein